MGVQPLFLNHFEYIWMRQLRKLHVFLLGEVKIEDCSIKYECLSRWPISSIAFADFQKVSKVKIEAQGACPECPPLFPQCKVGPIRYVIFLWGIPFFLPSLFTQTNQFYLPSILYMLEPISYISWLEKNREGKESCSMTKPREMGSPAPQHPTIGRNGYNQLKCSWQFSFILFCFNVCIFVTM